MSLRDRNCTCDLCQREVSDKQDHLWQLWNADFQMSPGLLSVEGSGAVEPSAQDSSATDAAGLPKSKF